MTWKDELFSKEYEEQEEKAIKARSAREHYRSGKDSRITYYKRKKESDPLLNRKVYAKRLATKPNYNKIRGELNRERQQRKWWAYAIAFIRENLNLDDGELTERLMKNWSIKSYIPRPLIPLAAVTPTYKPKLKTKKLDDVIELSRFVDDLARTEHIKLDTSNIYVTTVEYTGKLIKMDTTSEPGKVKLFFKKD